MQNVSKKWGKCEQKVKQKVGKIGALSHKKGAEISPAARIPLGLSNEMEFYVIKCIKLIGIASSPYVHTQSAVACDS